MKDVRQQHAQMVMPPPHPPSSAPVNLRIQGYLLCMTLLRIVAVCYLRYIYIYIYIQVSDVNISQYALAE